MAVNKIIRLQKAAREFNVGTGTIINFLHRKGFEIDTNPNTKLTANMYNLLTIEFKGEKYVKEEARKQGLDAVKRESISIEDRTIDNEDIIEETEQKELFIKQVVVDFNDEFKKSIESHKIRKTEPDKKTDVTTKVEEKTNKVDEVTTPELEPEKVKTEMTETEIEPAISEEQTKKSESENGKVTHQKILGKINLELINAKTKPPRKSPQEKRKEREEKRKAELTKNKKVEKKPLKPTPKIRVRHVDKRRPTVAKEQVIELVKKEETKKDNFIRTKVKKLHGPTIVGSIELPKDKKPVASSSDEKVKYKKKKRRRIIKQTVAPKFQKPDQTKDKIQKGRRYKKETTKVEPSEEEIQKQIKETLARLSKSGKSKSSKYRKQKRDIVHKLKEKELLKQEEGKKIIKVTEFVTANELAKMMNIPVTNVIFTCMQLGLFVSINQRLDAEAILLVAEEFGFKVEFVSVDIISTIEEEEDKPEQIEPRAPIVTVMGHVDHGKTKLLDYIRKTNVIAGEAGGITQHIGAYELTLNNRKSITFLDTPGHEAFTAMRARGAKVTDIVIVVIASDDNVMPQTKEAINHAQAAGVPIVFAINKIDKPAANPEKIKEQLSQMNILVEEWGGKYQSQDISAKKGINIDELLEKVMLEAEMLDLKANPYKHAHGTIIESSLDKGRGYVAKLLIQNGTMKIGDIVLAGSNHGKVKAMYNERNQIIKKAGPSCPVLLLGLNGAPQAGDTFNVMTDEHEVKQIATKRLQLQREQGLRTQKHITLDEIGRRIAIGDFKELNIIVKGDVDGSVEALSDSLLKLSTEKVQVNIIHKSVGQVIESDILLASASNAIIIGFQVRPSVGARKIAEREQIDIRLYSIIYSAIEEIKSAIEGMLAPVFEEKIICNLEIRETFKISKVGTIAGCMVLDGTITRNTKIRLIRDGVVVYTGRLGSLKRFKDDVKEVNTGYECGLNIENFNDIKVGDIIEGFEKVEVAKKLE